jgi:hypothetical protein
MVDPMVGAMVAATRMAAMAIFIKPGGAVALLVRATAAYLEDGTTPITTTTALL